MSTQAHSPDASPWWARLYDEHLATILLERMDPAALELDLRFVLEQLQVAPGARLFDQCCGIGSMAVPLAVRGYELVGVDLIDSYIARARSEAAAIGEGAAARSSFTAADAMHFRCEPPCEGGYNWWTSFGYAPDDETNLKMLERAFDSLLPGAKFVLDTMNAPGVRKHFEPLVETARAVDGGTLRLQRHSQLQQDGRSITKQWVYTLPHGSQVKHQSEVRLYDPPELASLFELAGFRDLTFFGDVDSSALTLDSRRCMVVATRPGQFTGRIANGPSEGSA